MTKAYLYKKGVMQMGPYPLDKMRALARQGQIGRSHRISADDGASWDNGAAFPEIFAADEEDKAEPAGSARSAKKSAQGPTGAPAEAEWYYCAANGDQQGPITEAQLLQLIEVGGVGPEDTVWTQVLGDRWVAASAVPKFSPLFRRAITPHTQTADTGVSSGARGMEGAVFCRECGARINRRAIMCPQCGVPTEHGSDTHRSLAPDAGHPRVNGRQEKSRLTAALFALLLGGLGAHHFYLGNIGLGILYLLFCVTLIPGIVAFVEGIVLLCMSDEAFHAKYCR